MTSVAHSKKPAYEVGFEEAIKRVKEILENEIMLAHTTKSGKTSRLTSAYNRITKICQKTQ